MAETYNLSVRDKAEYDQYTVEQLQYEVDGMNTMISKIREHRQMLMDMLNYKVAQTDMAKHVKEMSPMQRQALMQVLGVGTIKSTMRVNM